MIQSRPDTTTTTTTEGRNTTTMTANLDLGTEEFTDYLVRMDLKDGHQAAVDLAVAQAQARRLVRLLDDLAVAMDEVETDMITDTGKAGAKGRAAAYRDAAKSARHWLGVK